MHAAFVADEIWHDCLNQLVERSSPCAQVKSSSLACCRRVFFLFVWVFVWHLPFQFFPVDSLLLFYFGNTIYSPRASSAVSPFFAFVYLYPVIYTRYIYNNVLYIMYIRCRRANGRKFRSVQSPMTQFVWSLCFFSSPSIEYHSAICGSVTNLQWPCSSFWINLKLSLIHIWRCRRSTLCRSRWSPYH